MEYLKVVLPGSLYKIGGYVINQGTDQVCVLRNPLMYHFIVAKLMLFFLLLLGHASKNCAGQLVSPLRTILMGRWFSDATGCLSLGLPPSAYRRAEQQSDSLNAALWNPYYTQYPLLSLGLKPRYFVAFCGLYLNVFDCYIWLWYAMVFNGRWWCFKLFECFSYIYIQYSTIQYSILYFVNLVYFSNQHSCAELANVKYWIPGHCWKVCRGTVACTRVLHPQSGQCFMHSFLSFILS